MSPLYIDSDEHVGLGTDDPKARLHLGQGNPELPLDYNGTDAYYGSLRWSGLQFGKVKFCAWRRRRILASEPFFYLILGNMKSSLLVCLLFLIASSAFAQNSPISIWGTGLDGSDYQRSAIYSDVSNGFYFDAALTPEGTRLPITFSWRGGGVYPLYISPNEHVGLGTNDPKARLHLGQGNPELRLDYNGTDAYYGSLRWSGLQFGNNGANRIVAGRTVPGGRLEFFVNNTNEGANYQATPNGTLALLLAADGNVGIGTTDPQNKLDVNGTVRAKEVVVETNWPDYVFEPTYRLRPLHEVEAHIAASGHLPDVPPAAVVEADGLSLGEAQRIMMQKIEELTLYMIDQDKKIEAQQILLAAQQRELDALKAARRED